MPHTSFSSAPRHPFDEPGDDDTLALWREFNAGVWRLPGYPQQVDLFEEAETQNMLNAMDYSTGDLQTEDLSDILGDDDIAQDTGDDMFAPICVKPTADTTAVQSTQTTRNRHTDSAKDRHPSGMQGADTDADWPTDAPDRAPPQAPQVTVFTLPPHSHKVGDKETRERFKDAWCNLKKIGLERRLALPSRHWRAQLQQLRETFPNFQAAINLLEPHIGMLSQGYTGIHMRPLLLVGPPGIGKTKFAHSLAKVLQTPAPLFISMAEEDNGSALIGSSTYWSNSHPGQLFQELAWGRADADSAVANPLIILDEIDKACDHKTERSPLSALYRLLEAETAAHTEDRALPGIEMDARYVRFIATANELQDLPLPLRTRMEIVHVPAPTTEQRKHIAQSMAHAYARTHRLPLNPCIPEDVLTHMLHWDPRELKGKLELAMQMAVVQERNCVTLDCWEHVTQCSTVRTERQRIGFV